MTFHDFFSNFHADRSMRHYISKYFSYSYPLQPQRRSLHSMYLLMASTASSVKLYNA